MTLVTLVTLVPLVTPPPPRMMRNSSTVLPALLAGDPEAHHTIHYSRWGRCSLLP